MVRTTTVIFTGRNEVLAKVIFSQASVIHSVHRGGVCSKFSGGVSAPNFWGGGVGGCVCSKFGGGVSAPNFQGRGVCLRNTVNVRPVRILLECILLFTIFCPKK